MNLQEMKDIQERLKLEFEPPIEVPAHLYYLLKREIEYATSRTRTQPPLLGGLVIRPSQEIIGNS